MYKSFLNRKNKQSGVTLFIAVVIMGILLFISFAVSNITAKGSLFASSGRDSQFAFYAADAGIECAIYWDTKFDPSKFDPSVSGSPITCAGSTITSGQAIPGQSTTTLIGGGGSNLISTFSFVLNQGINPVPHCAIVAVTKRVDGTTHIKSKGYNTCDTNNPRRVERGVEVTY